MNLHMAITPDEQIDAACATRLQATTQAHRWRPDPEPDDG
jgi:hypothetical protein